MKYLRKFNESYSDDVQEFCDNNIAYLKDEGYKIYVNDMGSRIEVSFFMEEWWNTIDYSLTKFNWDDVKEDFIPFIELFNEKYSINGSLLFL